MSQQMGKRSRRIYLRSSLSICNHGTRAVDLVDTEAKKPRCIFRGQVSSKRRRITRGMDFVEFSPYRELCREFHADENASTDEGAAFTWVFIAYILSSA